MLFRLVGAAGVALGLVLFYLSHTTSSWWPDLKPLLHETCELAYLGPVADGPGTPLPSAAPGDALAGPSGELALVRSLREYPGRSLEAGRAYVVRLGCAGYWENAAPLRWFLTAALEPVDRSDPSKNVTAELERVPTPVDEDPASGLASYVLGTLVVPKDGPYTFVFGVVAADRRVDPTVQLRVAPVRPMMVAGQWGYLGALILGLFGLAVFFLPDVTGMGGLREALELLRGPRASLLGPVAPWKPRE